MFRAKLAVAILTISVVLFCHSTVAQEHDRGQKDSGTADREGSVKSSSTGSSSSIEYTEFNQATTLPREIKKKKEIKTFSTLAVGVKADTLGLGIELAAPLSQNFNLRIGGDFFSFNYPFTLDGVHYDARMHLQSGHASLDWFPGHRAFHVSPGIMYFKDSLSAPSSVPPGQYFELGDQGFTNSVDNPVKGTATVIFPRSIAPMLTLGFGNLIPRSGKHFSVPFEIGIAYTGAAQINVTLNGTACTTEGCFTFADNADAQASLKQEIHKFNEDLKRIPIYPIISIGLAYSF